MPSDQPSASTADADAAPAPLSSPRWKKPSSGPIPRMGDCNRGPNPSPLGPPLSRSELKRRLRESAEAAKLVPAAAPATRGSDASVAIDGGHQRRGLAGVAVDLGNGAVQSLWSDADEVTLLAAAAAFRERTGCAPRRADAGALFDSIRDSVSPHIDEAKACDKLCRLESKFLHGALGSSTGMHDHRVHDLSTKVWGVGDVVSPSEDGPDGQDAEARHLITERGPKPAPAVDALRPSDAAPMDTDAATAPASLPTSKKRSPSPQPGMGDAHQDPNSSPRGTPSRRSELNRRLRTSAESTVVAITAAAAARGSNVDGGHEEVQNLEAAGVAVDLGHGAAQRLEPNDDRGHGAAPNYPKTWSNADEVTLLDAAAAFRERTGQIPRNQNAGELFRSIRGSISPRINEDKVYCKLKRLKSKFRHEVPGESATTHDHLVHDLSAKVWGFVNAIAREGRDESTVMTVVTEVLNEFWKMNEQALVGLPLEKGLSLLRNNERRLIKTRWKKQLDKEMQTQMRCHDLAKEICVLLNDTIKELST